jgi:hypothetical protein
MGLSEIGKSPLTPLCQRGDDRMHTDEDVKSNLGKRVGTKQPNKKEALPRDGTLWFASHRDCTYSLIDKNGKINSYLRHPSHG